MCSLAGRVASGIASRDDMHLAGQLIIALVRRLPADAVVMLADDAPQRTVRAHLIANA